MFKKIGALGTAAVGAVMASPAMAAVDLSTLDAATDLGGVTTKVLAVGGVIIGLAVVGAAIKWIKGTIFS